MIVYTFKVHSLTKKTVNSVSDTVTAVVWERTGVDVDGYTGSHKVCTNLDTNQVGISTSYTIYDDLTKSDILSWIQSIEDMDDVNGIIAENIQKSRDNEQLVYEENLPWMSGS
tara:strand:- start:288 stop:626 length:339 start_codon:yes stop_codon:yes gene_type:complete